MCLQSTFTVEGDKLVQVQKWDGKETKLVREIKDGKMLMVKSNMMYTNTHSHLMSNLPSQCTNKYCMTNTAHHAVCILSRQCIKLSSQYYDACHHVNQALMPLSLPCPQTLTFEGVQAVRKYEKA